MMMNLAVGLPVQGIEHVIGWSAPTRISERLSPQFNREGSEERVREGEERGRKGEQEQKEGRKRAGFGEKESEREGRGIYREQYDVQKGSKHH